MFKQKNIPTYLIINAMVCFSVFILSSAFSEDDPGKIQKPAESMQIASVQPPKPFAFPQRSILTLDVAKRISIAAENKAKELNTSVAITILNENQIVKLQTLMDGQSPVALEWSYSKALAAFEFKQPTQKGDFRILNISGKTMILGTPGGYPLIFSDSVIGAVGISGTKGNQDEIIAQAAIDEYNKILNPS